MFDFALSSEALSHIGGRDDLIAATGDCIAPAVTSAAEGRMTGYAISGDMVAPAVQVVAFGDAVPTALTFVGEQRSADASGKIAVGYPPGTQYGDFAILVLGWETAASGVFSRPVGWNAGPLTETTSTCGQVWTQRVKDTASFEMNPQGTREGGGYIMHVYRRAQLSDEGKNNGNSDFVAFPSVTLPTTDNYVSVFAVSVGQPNILTSGDVTAPYVALETLVGESDDGKATMWSANGQIAASGAHTPPNIDPSFSGIAAHVWASFSVSLKDDPLWHFSISADFVAPAATIDIAGTLTRTATGSFIAPFALMAGTGVVNKSGREVCINTGQSANSVSFAASVNSVTFAASQNSITIEPLEPNRVC